MATIVSFENFKSKLSGRKYDAQYTNVPNKNLPKDLQAQLNQVLAVVGRKLEPEDYTLTVKADEKILQFLGTPSVFKKDDEAVVRWGSETFPLKEFQTENCELSIVANEKDKTVSVSLYITPADHEAEADIDDISLIFELPLRFPKTMDADKRPPLASMNRQLKTGTLHTLLENAPSGVMAKKITELEENQEYKIHSYTGKEGSYGMMFIMEMEDGTRVLANNMVADILSCNPTITPETPATLCVGTFATTKTGKTRANATLLIDVNSYSDSDDFSLDF